MIAAQWQIDQLIKRVEALEKHSHEPFDFTALIARLDAAESRIAELEQDVEYLRNASRAD